VALVTRDRPAHFHLSLPACVVPVPVPVPVLALPALPSIPRGFCVCLPAVVVTATAALCCSPAQTSRLRDGRNPSHPCRAQTPADRSLVLTQPARASCPKPSLHTVDTTAIPPGVRLSPILSACRTEHPSPSPCGSGSSPSTSHAWYAVAAVFRPSFLPANKPYRSWEPSNTKTDHGTTTTQWPWSPSLPARPPNPSAPFPTTSTSCCAPRAQASSATTNPHMNTTREARRNWTMPRSEEEAETTQHQRRGDLIQRLRR
jgi:hypothetical protein